MPGVKKRTACSLGDLKSGLKVLKKRHDSLIDKHQRSHREFMEYGIGGPAERKRLYTEGQKLNQEADEILQAAHEINREMEKRREEGFTC